MAQDGEIVQCQSRWQDAVNVWPDFRLANASPPGSLPQFAQVSAPLSFSRLSANALNDVVNCDRQPFN